jgi:phosphoadenosine phosphosulfate reductase
VNHNTTPRAGNDANSQNSRQLRNLSAVERIEWAYRRFGEALVLNSSFGPQSIVCLSLAIKVHPGVPVVMVELPGPDYDMQRLYRDYLKSTLELNLHILRAQDKAGKKAALCEFLHSQGAQASISGIRRQQTRNRARKDLFESDRDYPAMMKIHPIADWSDIRTWRYIEELPDEWRHPGYRRGLRSIGGVLLDAGQVKTECGLHL